MTRPTAAVCAFAAAMALLGIRPLTAGQTSAPARERVNVSEKGPQVGERVPDFSLTDQNGRTRTLQSLMGQRGLMLVFIRSADW
jgi:cytochrome oxidase Cu insertion factor (SCO1/SenC/PrrC family)